VIVHDVHGDLKSKASGLIVVSAKNGAVLEDVVVDGAAAYGTTQWSGIYVSGTQHAIVRNSIAHDVYGDGIVIFSSQDGLIEKSAVWRTGMQVDKTIGTPNGIWTWECRDCTVQDTEGFWTDSPGDDGGVYDIDWGDHDNIIQRNYAHDAQGYCAAVFGAGHETTTNSIVRYNVCVNNGRSPRLAPRAGDLNIVTWDGGSVDGVLIYNNTFYWNPPSPSPPIKVEAEFTASRPNAFFNNIVYSTVPTLIDTSKGISYQNNFYWYPGEELPTWSIGGQKYTGLPAYRQVADRESFTDPKLNWMAVPLAASPVIERSIPVPRAAGSDRRKIPDVGAMQFSSRSFVPENAPPTAPPRRNRWTLMMIAGEDVSEARSQLVFVQAALAQYGGNLLDATIVPNRNYDLENDLNLGSVRLVSCREPANQLCRQANPALLLISPEGTVVHRWSGFAPPAELGLTLKHYLGPAISDADVRFESGAQSSADADRGILVQHWTASPGCVAEPLAQPDRGRPAFHIRFSIPEFPSRQGGIS
jgi:hypothetical protein